MSASKRFSLASRIKSFGFALSGLRTLLKEEPNALIHVIMAGIAIIMAVICNISVAEWLFILVFIALVIGAELLNTALEILCDLVQPEIHPAIKKVKDLSAAAVLIFAIISLIGGLIIFIPKIITIIS